MKNSLLKITTLSLLLISTITASVKAHTFESMNLIVNDPWNSNINSVPAPEGAMNVSPMNRSRTLSDFADYVIDFGYGKIQNHQEESEISLLYSNYGVNGIEIEGVLEFQADRNITVTELASLLLTNGNIHMDLDVPWHERIITEAKKRDMVTDEMVTNMNEPISREEMAYMLIQCGKSLDIIVGNTPSYINEISDIDEAEELFKPFIKEAYFLGLLTSSDGQYRPKTNITRAETCAIINKLFDFKM